MKKIIFTALAASALLSCSKDQVIEQNRANDEIEFSIAADNQTKAAQVYCANNLMTEFTVYSSYKEGENTKWYIQGDKIVKDGASWKNSTATRYWTAHKHNFYAVVNGTITINNTDAKVAPKVEGFTPATTVADQKDLLYAVATDKDKSSPSVALNFRHALSQIEFKAKNTNSKFHVVINGVRVGHTPGKGTFTFPATSTDETFTDHAQAGNHAHATGTWDITGATPADYTVKLASGISVAGTSTPVNITISTDADDASRNFANSMLLIPTTTTQLTPNASSFNGTYLAVDCEIYNVAGTSFNSATDVKLHDGWAVIPVSFAWEPGKKYIYTFVFGEGNGGYDGGTGETPTPGTNPVLTPISYTVTVDDFQKGVDSDSDSDVDMKF